MTTAKRDGGKRWFSTGFMVGGVGAVDSERHALKDAVVIRPGEARGHDVWIDAAFCADVVAKAAALAEKGIKARFGHPNMCSEALGTFLGRWKNLRQGEDGRVIGDLYLSSTAAESPKGDLRKYVEEMAAKEPLHFGASIVFTMDTDAMDSFLNQHAVEVKDDKGEVVSRVFRSPDPANEKNFPHARCAELHAADLVDDPAATDGMFAGAAGLSLAAQMTEFLDTHPGVLKALTDDPELINIVERYSDQLKPFLSRYAANQAAAPTHINPESEPGAPAESGAPTEAESRTPAEPDAALTAKVAALEALLNDGKAEAERLSGQLAAASQRADTAEAAVKALTAERDELAAKVKTVQNERDSAQHKLRAIESGAEPVSSKPAEPTDKPSGNMWADACKRK